jgi:hypothetical protein
MARARTLAAVLTALVAVLLVAFAGTAGAAAPKKHGRLIVNPRAGQVVEANTVRIGVRRGAGLRVWLNGRRLATKEFGRARRQVRSLEASISHGLRQGQNVVRVRVKQRGKVRHAKLRFRVNAPDPLVGAGRDAVAGVGYPFQLAGLIGPGGSAAGIEWTPIREPEEGEQGCPEEKAVLHSPNGPTASFRPPLPGRYVFRARSADGAADRVEVTASAPNRLPPFETMAGSGAGAGIKVGRTTYLLSKASTPAGADRSGLQVLVLERETLKCVSNTRYASVTELNSDLHAKEMDSSKLVVVAMQPGATGSPSDGKALYEALGSIGFPKEKDGALPTFPGSFSGVGVPKMNQGDADVNILPAGSGETADMVGYLTPDQYGNFGYVPSRSAQFILLSKGEGPCGSAQQCEEKTGFFVRNLNPRTLAPGPDSGTFYATGWQAHAADAVTKMTEALEHLPAGNVVEIETRSGRSPENDGVYLPPVAKVSKAQMVALANAVAEVGGTKNAFNKIARLTGEISSFGLTYALVGWQGAEEGEGAESAAGVYGEPAGPGISGILRPDRRSLMRPAQISSLYPTESLAGVVMEPPTTKWPLEGNLGAMKAFRWLGGVDKRLGAEPRVAYWSQELDADTWNTIGKEVAAKTYAEVPAPQQAEFSKAQFEEARKELSQELFWVAKVREFLDHLSKPFEKERFASWAQAQTIADEIYSETKPPDTETTLHWIEFTSIMLKLAGPLTAHVSNEMGEVLDLGVWAFGADKEGHPSYDGVSIKAHALGKTLSEQMAAAAATYEAMGDVIVSDPKKLALVGTYALCKPGPGCKEAFSFDAPERKRASADLRRSVERLTWEKLLPLGFNTYRLHKDKEPEFVAGKPRSIHKYACGWYAPWKYFNEFQTQQSVGNMLLELDPQGTNNRWQILVFARPEGNYGYAPDEKVLKNLTEPVPKDNSPEQKGLGISMEKLISEEETELWSPNSGEPEKEREDACYWEP